MGTTNCPHIDVTILGWLAVALAKAHEAPSEVDA